MKVTKSLLLGAAAGFVAMSGAQAADLPVKAKPVEYVKICSAYGAGFYYIPGTDICLRVGGYVFVETGVKGRNAAVDVIYSGDNFNRDDNYSQWRARGHVILDARNNTAYGTLRAYFVGGVSYATTAPAGQVPSGANTGASMDRAFIQFAGFTAGFTESFFSFGGAYSIVAGGALPWDWLPLIAYTAQLGNGVSATVSVEDGGARRSNIRGLPGVGTTSVAGAPVGAYGGEQAPDVVANVRVDQAWGSAQIMGALHQVRTNTVLANAGAGDKWGYAFGGGFEIKTPQTGNPNNSFLAQAQWTKGAVEYTGLASSPVTTASALGFATGSAILGSGAFAPIADAWATGGAGSGAACSIHHFVDGSMVGLWCLPALLDFDAAHRLCGGLHGDRQSGHRQPQQHPGREVVPGLHQHDLVAGRGPRSQPRPRLLEGEDGQLHSVGGRGCR